MGLPAARHPGGEGRGWLRRGARSLVLPAAVLVASAVPYLPLLRAGYVQDDHLAIEENPIVARSDVLEIFSTSYWAGAKGDDRSLYRPVPVLTFALERAVLGEPSAPVSHAINIGLHAAVSGLLFAVARRLGLGPAGSVAAGLLFAVHPVHSEAVASGVGRSEILAALFSLAALLAASFTGAWRRPGADDVGGPPPLRARSAAWVTGVCVFLALGSKETALALIPVLGIQEALFRKRVGASGRFWIERAASFAPVALAVEIFLILRIRALEALDPLQSVPAIDNPIVALDPAGRLLTALAIAARYAWRLVAGYPLSADYSGPVIGHETSLLAPLPLAGLAFLAAWAVVALLPLRFRRATTTGSGSDRRAAALAAWIFLLPYLVVGNLLVPIGAGLAERLVYLPSAGLALLAGVAVQRVTGGVERAPGRLGRDRIARLVVATSIVALACATAIRTRDWKDDRTLFESAVRANARSVKAHYILATLDERAGRPDRALSRVETVLGLWPDHLAATVQKTVLLGRMGDLKGAEAMARRATRLDPLYALGHFNLGLALQHQGRLAEAERAFRKSVLADPGVDSAWTALGHVRFETRRYAAAAEAYSRAIALGRPNLEPRLREARSRALVTDTPPGPGGR